MEDSPIPHLPRNLTKKTAQPIIHDFIKRLRSAAREAKNIQTKQYLNIQANNMVQSEKLANQRTQ